MKRAIINGVYVKQPTNDQLTANKRFADAAEYHRDADQSDNYKDLIQPYMGNKPNPEFIKAYPTQAKKYFSAEELKNY